MHCLEKFANCLKKAHCENLPMYIQATEIIAHPEKYTEELKVDDKSQEASVKKSEEAKKAEDETIAKRDVPKAEL